MSDHCLMGATKTRQVCNLLLKKSLLRVAIVSGVTAQLPQGGFNLYRSHFSESEGFVDSSQNTLVTAEVCAHIKRSGYAQSQIVRIYGEEFEILSDPFPNDSGVAVRVRSRRSSEVRALQLPATLVPRTNNAPGRAA